MLLQFFPLLSFLLWGGKTGASTPLPTVDLGYEIHQAIAYNPAAQYYNFTNIRYGRAPTGDLRFSAPEPPLTNRTAVQTGAVGGTCPQAYPVWYLCGLALLSGEIESAAECNASLIPEPEPLEREDCLFLDVIVPKAILSSAAGMQNGTDKATATGAPIMVWIYGGGFTFGKKYGDGDPASLMDKARQEDPTGRGVIYVTLNYRGGAFGFLSGPTLEAGGTPNAGLLDQRLALEWVQKYIHLFGGDPNRVTVFGQSAGAGSVMHQITAYGGLGSQAPFQQAILQSPGFEPFPGREEQENLTQRYLALLKVSSISAARQLPLAALSAANVELVASSPYGTFTFAPAVDGSFVPALPGVLLAQGLFDTSVKIMTGFNAHETLYFTNPDNTNNSIFEAGIQDTFPDIQSSVVDYIAGTLYPPVFNGRYPYTSYFERAELTLAESAFTCNTYFLHRAVQGRSSTYGYRFSVPPAYHGEDVPYTYFNGPSPRVANATIAEAMQSYLTRFALSGNPNGAGAVVVPEYWPGAAILDLNITGSRVIPDPNNNVRCRWWQEALYY